MKIENHFAAVSLVSPSELSFSQMEDMCAGIDAQLHEDAYPHWGRKTHILPFRNPKDAPQGFWPALIKDDINEPGAAGFHTDEHNQPKIYVQFAGEDTSFTLSHEATETVPDPFGNRLIPVNHPTLGHIRILCEIADPPEEVSYRKKGIKVSDFITPEWYDIARTEGTKYSFTGACKNPLELLPGGYFSFIRNGRWEQATRFNGDAPTSIRVLGMLDPTKMLREWIDELTRAYKSEASQAQ